MGHSIADPQSTHTAGRLTPYKGLSGKESKREIKKISPIF